MELRPLGKTGLIASRIGLGLASLGRPGYLNLGHAADLQKDYDREAMESRAHDVLTAARESGVRYFDVARSYGAGEEFLSSWLRKRNIKPADVVVGSKWGYTYVAGWRADADQHEVKEHSLPVFQRQLGETRVLLGNHLDLYQIHSATIESGVLDYGPVLDALARLKTEGVKIGLSITGPGQSDTLRKALMVKRDGVCLFDCVQATWNLLERSAGPALAEAHATGLGVIVKEAMANGRLTTRNTNPTFGTQLRLLQDVAADLGTTLDALALAAVLAQPWADVVLSGAATREQLASNLTALQVPWSEQVTARLAVLVEESKVYWAIRSKLPWN